MKQENCVYKLFILRGCPGSGKSTVAEELISNNPEGLICSADNYFIDDKGKYRFISNHLSRAHKWCQKLAGNAMKQKVECIVIDNTNTTRKEMKPYIDMAEKHGYRITVLTVGEYYNNSIREYAKRNIHNVPADKVYQMGHRIRNTYVGEKDE